jgi:hypothetical protein
MNVINITPYQVPNNHATNSALQPHNDMPTVNLTPPLFVPSRKKASGEPLAYAFNEPSLTPVDSI